MSSDPIHARRPSRLNARFPRAGLLVIASLVAGCGGDATDVEASLTVSLTLEGNGTDGDGVEVRAVSRTAGAVRTASGQPGSSSTLSVDADTYDLTLVDLAAHCWAEPETQAVSVAAGAQASATIAVTCVGDFAYAHGQSFWYLGTDGALTGGTSLNPFATLSWNPSGSGFLVEEFFTTKCTVSFHDVTAGTTTPVGSASHSYQWPWPVWSPTGNRLVLARTAGCTVQSADEAIMLYDGTGTTALDSLVGPDPGGMAWRPGSEEIAYSAAGEVRLHSWADGSDSLFVALAAEGLAWSPDGMLLAVEVTSGAGQQIVVLDLGATEVFRVGAAGAPAAMPVWAPDGSGFLFGTGAGEGDIAWVASDGAGERLVTSGDGGNGGVSWAPDGSYFLYVAQPQGLGAILLGSVLPGAGPPRTVVTLGGAVSPLFRPTAVLGLD